MRKIYVMSKTSLGEFEEIVLLTVAVLDDEAYGVAIIKEIKDRLERNVSVGATQTALRRMEAKKFLTAEFGEATKVRGGKRKKYFRITPFGVKVLRENREVRQQLWAAIPSTVLDLQIQL